MEITIEGYLQLSELFKVSLCTNNQSLECYMTRQELQGFKDCITNVEEIEQWYY